MKLSALTSALSLLVLPGLTIAQPQAAADEGWMPIETIVRQVAADMDREFIIDPRVRGSQGFTTSEEVDYDSLLSILRINNLAAVESGDQVLIVPDQLVRSQATRVLQEDDRSVPDSEIVTRIIEVPAIPASESVLPAQVDGQNPFVTAAPALAIQLVPVLRPMMSQNAQLGAVPGTNKLILVDRYDNIRRMTTIIEAIVEGLDD